MHNTSKIDKELSLFRPVTQEVKLKVKSFNKRHLRVLENTPRLIARQFILTKGWARIARVKHDVKLQHQYFRVKNKRKKERKFRPKKGIHESRKKKTPPLISLKGREVLDFRGIIRT